MGYRIELDESADRSSYASYLYRVYDDDRLIARYWHDHRGDEHGIDFVDGTDAEWPFELMTDFVQGGGPEPLELSDRAVAYLDSRKTVQ